MHARVTLLEIDTVRADIDDVLERYRTEVLPQVHRQPGYEGMFVLANAEGQGLIMSLWSDDEAMAASHPIASEALERFMTIFRASPGRESYEVRLAELPAHAIE